MDQPKGYYTVSEASYRLSIPSITIRKRMLRRGIGKGMGKTWYLRESELSAIAQPSPRGNPHLRKSDDSTAI